MPKIPFSASWLPSYCSPRLYNRRLRQSRCRFPPAESFRGQFLSINICSEQLSRNFKTRCNMKSMKLSTSIIGPWVPWGLSSFRSSTRWSYPTVPDIFSSSSSIAPICDHRPPVLPRALQVWPRHCLLVMPPPWFPRPRSAILHDTVIQHIHWGWVSTENK